MASFDQLNLSERALEAVGKLGFKEPTPIQERAIPQVLIGGDIVASAKTGTGKTLAFALPTLDMIASSEADHGRPRLMILAPTRELAGQIEEVCRPLAKHFGLRITCIVGGVDEAPQVKKLSAGTDVVIGTPGRILDLNDRELLVLDRIETLVLDEADRMLDMGFLPQVKGIVEACPVERQTLLFSATIDKQVEKQLGSLLHDPAHIEVHRKGETVASIRQYAIEIDHRSKPQLLKSLLKEQDSRQTIIFARTKRRVDSCLEHLRSWGYSAIAMHSGKSQAQRRRALADFARGSAKIMVATDVIARGIDLETIDVVVNYDIPLQAEDYVHRIGRTGRAGAKGVAYTFVTPENKREMLEIENLLGKPIERYQLRRFKSEENDRAIASKATRRNARKDPELAAAAKEYEARLKKAKRRKEARETQESAPKGKPNRQSAGASRPKKQKPASAKRNVPKQTGGNRSRNQRGKAPRGRR